VVAILIHEALAERQRNGAAVWSPSILALALANIIGLIDEVIQLFLPSRVFDIRDIVANSLSAGLALVAKLALHRASERRLARQSTASPPSRL
jgi:VanZ family protein